MRTQLEARLSTLKSEYESGQKMLSDLEARRAQLTQTLLRIEGAMQVIQEMLQHEAEPRDTTPPLREAER